jgi:anaerobic dimethyl sulfoxide reductase subunit B (iron-sulfur subunit)
MAKQMAFYFDSSACGNCKACQIACQDKNNLPSYLRWRRVVQYAGGSWSPSPHHPGVMVPNIFSYSISIACMHCEEPACVNVCPSAAITKGEDGIVLVDQDKCIGCRYCEWACPYGAPQFDEQTKVMSKCTFCVDLQAQGKNPACVDACVMRCLHFGELEELKQQFGDVQAVAPLPSPDITHPSFVITPHQNAQPIDSTAGKLLNLPEEV